MITLPERADDVMRRVRGMAYRRDDTLEFMRMLRMEFGDEVDAAVLSEYPEKGAIDTLSKATKSGRGLLPEYFKDVTQLKTSSLLKDGVPGLLVFRVAETDLSLSLLLPALRDCSERGVPLGEIGVMTISEIEGRLGGEKEDSFKRRGAFRDLPISGFEIKCVIKEFQKPLRSINEYLWAVE